MTLEASIQFAPNVSTDVVFEEVAETLIQGFAKVKMGQVGGFNQPTEANRAKQAALFRAESQKGALVVEDVNHESMAVWFPPAYPRGAQPKTDDGATKEPDQEVFDLIAEKELAADERLDMVNKNWYLHFLARRPGSTSSSSLLVRPVLERASKDGLRCSLLCVNADVLPVYEHWGFEVRETFNVKGAVCWYMVKEP